MDPTQLYETVVVNRDPDAPPADDHAMRFVTIPARSLTFGEVPPVERLAEDLGLEQIAKPRRGRAARTSRSAPRRKTAEATSMGDPTTE